MMRWLARRAPANSEPPQADLAGAREADDPRPDTGELLAAAERFLALFHGENPGAGALSRPHAQVRERGESARDLPAYS